MAGAIVNKVLNMFGVDAKDEETGEGENEERFDFEPEYEGEQEDVDEREERGIFGIGRRNKIVSMPQVQVKMKISKPTSFEQSEEICNLLKEKKSIIVNLEYVNKDVARRIVDFISGAVHALDGHIEKISNSIFLVAPYNYEIVNDMARDEIKSKISVSWLRNNTGTN